MKTYLLDTSICISLIRHDAYVISKIHEVGQDNCYVSEMTIAELTYGAWKSGNAKHFQDVADIELAFDVLPIYPSLTDYGRVKCGLERKGQRVDELDLFIAATAITNSCVMVTHNIKHFNRIVDLQIENWIEQ